ncbi:hypothetical protein KAR91_77885, partial [Candidatus Pacearchaeota archaeon]|nr:hypothetical protein [Candidatus Pacearchaeota archaeon]
YYPTQIDSTTKFNIATTPDGIPIVFTDAGTAFTTNTSGVGAPVKLGNDYEDYTCVVTWGGTAPTNTTIKVYAGIDGLNYTLLDTQTITVTGSNFTINNYPNMFLLGEFSAKTGGGATTAATLKCMPGRN